MSESAATAPVTSITFRPFDAEAFARDAAAFLEIAADVPGEYWTAENFAAARPEKELLSFAAYAGERPVAYAVLSRPAAGRIHLHHLMVAPPWRRRGLGTRMIEAMLERARAAGASELGLKARAPEAQAFYRRHGFFRIGVDNAYPLFVRRLDWASGRRVVVAIHQPNYLPWLGYFRKLARADVFVLLDGAQFSKGSYTNRVQILRDGKAAWLTQPVQQALGQPISSVGFADPSWPKRHIDALHGAYRGAPVFRETFPILAGLIEGVPLDSLVAANRYLIEGIATRLGLAPCLVADAALEIDGVDGDDRLIALINAVSPGACYLSGKGGRAYQDEGKFAAAGIELRYSDYSPQPYAQAGAAEFVPGLSIVDALFALGIEGTRALIVASG